jgi:hypothetical protein
MSEQLTITDFSDDARTKISQALRQIADAIEGGAKHVSGGIIINVVDDVLSLDSNIRLLPGGQSVPIRQNFYAVFADGREERLISITVLNGEVLYETLERTAIEIGAVKIVIKPEEAQAVVV